MAEDTPDRRSQIRAEINKTSREEFVLKEMKRLGFWPDDQEKPTLAEAHIQRRSELSSEIRKLSKEHKQYESEETVLNRYKKERLQKSRESQKETKKKRNLDRIAKQNARRKALATDITYLGKNYHHQLKNKECDLDQLAKNHLPIIQDVARLATELDTTVNELRFLSFERQVSHSSHYIRYGIKKKSGGIRKISAPQPRLKKVQRAILDKILARLKVSDYAHGFINNKSIVSNATPHIGADVVVNMDLKNFFPTIDYKRVYGLFVKLGFSTQISTILALICTEPDEQKIRVHGQIKYYNQGERFLPQGAPTSPMLTNIICRRMDARMAGIAKQLGFTYTRYADDMTFSGPKVIEKNIKKLLWRTKAVLKNEDFHLHPDKTKIMRKGQRKEVTGIVVNEKPNLSKKKLKAFRALLYQIEKDGPQGKNWGDSPDVLASAEGFARYVYMVNPQKGKPLLAQMSKINKRYKPKKVIKKILSQKKKGGSEGKPWWKFW